MEAAVGVGPALEAGLLGAVVGAVLCVPATVGDGDAPSVDGPVVLGVEVGVDVVDVLDVCVGVRVGVGVGVGDRCGVPVDDLPPRPGMELHPYSLTQHVQVFLNLPER